MVGNAFSCAHADRRLGLGVARCSTTGCRTRSPGTSTSSCSSTARSSPRCAAATRRPTSPRPSVSWSTSWAIPSTRRTSAGPERGRRSRPDSSTTARREAIEAADITGYFTPISLPIAARAALWAADQGAARELIGRLEPPVDRGRAIALDLATLRAGLAALEGRRAEAIAGYREALRGWRSLGLAFDEALAGLDLAILLAPTEREMTEAPAAIATARETLARLGAPPLLARLDAAPGPTTNCPGAETPGPSAPLEPAAEVAADRA